MLLFPVVARCCYHLWTLSLTSLLSEVRPYYLNYSNTYSGCFVILVNMTIKFSQFQKNSHMFDVMPNNFWCTDWRPDCYILYPLHTQDKSRKDSAQCWTEFFTDSKTELGAFYPKRNTRVKIKLTSTSCRLLFYVVYMCQKSLNFIDAFGCYKQKWKLAPFNLAHPVCFYSFTVFYCVCRFLSFFFVYVSVMFLWASLRDIYGWMDGWMNNNNNNHHNHNHNNHNHNDKTHRVCRNRTWAVG